MDEIINSIDWDSLLAAAVAILSTYGVALLGNFISSIKTAITNSNIKKQLAKKSELTEAEVNALIEAKTAAIEAKYEKKYQEFTESITLQLNDNKVNNDKEVENATAELEKSIDNIGIEE